MLNNSINEIVRYPTYCFRQKKRSIIVKCIFNISFNRYIIHYPKKMRGLNISATQWKDIKELNDGTTKVCYIGKWKK